MLRQPQAVPAADHVIAMSGHAYVYIRPPYAAVMSLEAQASTRAWTLFWCRQGWFWAPRDWDPLDYPVAAFAGCRVAHATSVSLHHNMSSMWV